MKLLFIRHAESEVNAQGLMHTANDTVGLSEEGKRQAHKLIEVCRKYKVERIYCSPAERAFQTAYVITKALDVNLEIKDELKERDWGTWEGKSWNGVKMMLDVMTLDERYTFIPPQGESWKQMEDRLKKFLTYITSLSCDSVGIVTHGGVLRGLMPITLNEPKESSFKYDFDNASVTVVDYCNKQYKVELINDVSHLL